MSLFLALVMLVGVALPSVAMAAPEVTKTEKVTLHKLLMTKTELQAWDSGKVEKGTKDVKGYNGTQDLAGLNTILKALDPNSAGVKEIAGVYFAWQKVDDTNKYKTNKENKFITENGELIKDDQNPNGFEEIDKIPENLKKSLALNWKYINASGDIVNPTKNTKEAFNTAKVFGGLTGENGHVFDTSNLPQDKATSYRIVEVHELSTYKGTKGETLTDMKAVPVEITLPLVNDDGVQKEVHVYPKNTEDKPKIDKNFAKPADAKDNLEVAPGFDPAEQGAGVNTGANYENYKKTKDTAKAEIGKVIPYEVKTEIPAQTKWATAKWDDKMTEGLTYKKDSLTIKLERNGSTIDLVAPKAKDGTSTIDNATEKQPESDYTLNETDNGFVLEFTKTGLAKINNQSEVQTITLTYSATVNNKAVVDIPESNDVTFHYGNNPGKGNTPLPTKPNENGEVTVVKTWDNGSEWVEGEYAKFKLVDANTGKDVTKDDLVGAPEGYTFEGTVKLEKNGKTSHTWEYLNKDKQYKVIEVESKTLADAEYKVNEQGKIEVTNHKTDNPTPLNPTEPKVVTGGKKFVKTNADGTERLAGAEFYVKNGTGTDAKYLVVKEEKTKNIATAKKTLEDAVKAYNSLSAEEQKGETGKTKKTEIDTAQKAYDKAIKENASKYTWGEKTDDNVVVLTSDAQGRFEITGLAYGTYYLEEKTPPAGYAKRNDTPEFTVEKGSYTSGDISYDDIKVLIENATDETEITKDADIKGMKFADAKAKFDSNKDGKLTVKELKDAKQIINKKVSIPQTGGIGTVIFTVVGISLMAGAFIAMRKRTAEEN